MLFKKERVIQIILASLVTSFILFLVYYASRKTEEDTEIPEQKIETPEGKIRRELLAPPQYPIPEVMEQQIREDLLTPSQKSFTEEQQKKILEDLKAPLKY